MKVPLHAVGVTEAERIAELEKSHAGLRGALIFAGRRIRKLTNGGWDQEPSLAVLRDVLRNARAVAKKGDHASSAGA